jgi:hypothetical protein
MSRGAAALAAAAVVAAAVVAVIQGVLAFVAARQRKRFYKALGPVVRIATPCRVVEGRALVPASVGLTPKGLAWHGLAGVSGSVPFEEIARMETDARLATGRRFLRSEVLRVTLTSGASLELVLTRADAWEWRRALGEWVGRKGGLDADAAAPR